MKDQQDLLTDSPCINLSKSNNINYQKRWWLSTDSFFILFLDCILKCLEINFGIIKINKINKNIKSIDLLLEIINQNYVASHHANDI